MKFIRFFDEIGADDVGLVGGKNASLGELAHLLKNAPVQVPYGFAITADAYREHLKEHQLVEPLKKILAPLGAQPAEDVVQRVGAQARELVGSYPLSSAIADEVGHAYKKLCQFYNQENLFVAVRSSATAEDLPGASFAGQYETYLYISGPQALLDACIRCMASIFTDRAIVYRREKGFDDFAVALSIGVQKMVAADEGSSGVIFTLEPDTGAASFVAITAVYGLGETIVQGQVTPDEWLVHKETFQKGYYGIVRKTLGVKDKKLIFRPRVSPDVHGGLIPLGTAPLLAKSVVQPQEVSELVAVPEVMQQRFALTDEEVQALTKTALHIEEHYSTHAGHWMPMDIEWARDGNDGTLYIVQARPETVHSRMQHQAMLKQCSFVKQPAKDSFVVKGRSVGDGMVAGRARVLHSLKDQSSFKKGDILVADMTDPDWVPLMRIAGALVTNRGGRTCHAAIVSRELGIPALVGTENGTELIHDGEEITVECKRGSTGTVYRGIWEHQCVEVPVADTSKRAYKLYVNIAEPDEAMHAAVLPVDGVGLVRLEFMISSTIGVHPMACAEPSRVKDEAVRKTISERLGESSQWAQVYVDRLAQNISCIAAAFYPRPVVVRCTDFKSNEYRSLLGGTFFEPVEENPMLGFRGAARYIHAAYAPAFALECKALAKVHEVWGLENVKLLIPFVRSLQEAEAVIKVLAENKLRTGSQGLELLMMVEIPQNVLLLDRYAKLFDGFSIGSNDLAQLTLGVDRDSGLVAHLFDERDDAVRQLLFMAIDKAKKAGKPIGICGQAPSDFPDLAHELLAQGITYLSLLPETVPSFIALEKKCSES